MKILLVDMFMANILRQKIYHKVNNVVGKGPFIPKKIITAKMMEHGKIFKYDAIFENRM